MTIASLLRNALAAPMMAIVLGVIATAATAAGQAHAAGPATPSPHRFIYPVYKPEIARQLNLKWRKAVTNAGKLLSKTRCNANPAGRHCIKSHRNRISPIVKNP